MPCAIKRSNVGRQLRAQELLATSQVRQLYADFTQWGNDSGRANKLAAGAARYLQFLVKLDISLQQQPGVLNQDWVVQTFTTEELRQMGLLSQFMAESGLLNDDAVMRRRRSDSKLLTSKLEAVRNQPWAADIERFHETLSTREPSLTLRTQKANLHAAIALLTHSDVQRGAHVTQELVNGLISKKPGLRASLTSFLAYLEVTHGKRLSLKSKSARPVSAVRQAKYVKRLLDAVEAAPRRPTQLALVATLLSVLLNVPLEQILRLRHSDLDLENFAHLRLDGKWLPLTARMRPILKILPSAQWMNGLDTDPPLFAGRMLMDGMSLSTVRYHVKVALGEIKPG